MQPVFLFKKRTGAMGGHVAGTAGFCVAVPAFYSWSMSEVIDKDTRSSERTDYPHYASEVALAFGSRVVGLELAKMIVGCVAGRTVRRRSSSTTRGGDYGNRAAEKLRFIHYLHG
ncbi:putative sugar-phosphate isomerase [Escherichia coli]|uniref:Putative sugar-phosphate isomerase n=1 Tax=Escherichia coli TaxID=562 RepID=A0A376L316_ECOLX|nr:putative sugar-phosphate isomerase [Escherichia coli]